MNLLRLYNFRMPRNILFGIDAETQVGEKAKELKGTRALIVTDRMLASGGAIDKVKKGLTGSGMEVEVYDGVVTESTTEYVEEGTDKLKSSACDVGGGTWGRELYRCSQGH